MTNLIDTQNAADLRSQPSDIRRELVWAAAHLLWFSETFEAAADALMRLAEAENETYSNNASGILGGFFQLRLGGTQVTYSVRLEWWDSAAQDALLRTDLERLELLCDVLSNGLVENEMRTQSWRGSRLQPVEWRPTSFAEAASQRLHVWQRLLRLTDQASIVTHVGEVLARHLRSVVSCPFAADVIRQIGEIQWPRAVTRSRLAVVLRDLLRYDASDSLDISLRETIQLNLELLLGGVEVLAQLPALLATEPWNLSDRSFERVPPVFVTAADELVRSIGSAELPEVLTTTDSNDQALYQLGQALGSADLGGKFRPWLETTAEPAPASVGYFAIIARNDQDAAFEILRGWLRLGFYNHVVSGATCFPATTVSLELALEAYRAAQDDGSTQFELNRLVFGSWPHPLPPEAALDLLEALSSLAAEQESYAALDAAMFAIHSYLEQIGGVAAVPSLAREFKIAGRDLLSYALTPWGQAGRDLSYMRALLLTQLALPPVEALDLQLASMNRPSFPSVEEVNAVKEICSSLGVTSLDIILTWLTSLEFGASLFVAHIHLVSIMVTSFGTTP
jgi:hypothetical protein